MFALFRKEDSIILPLEQSETSLGRHTTNTVVINSLPVSRHHSTITIIDGRLFIKDKSTINGTYIGKHKILPDRETQLKVQDNIGIGCKPGDIPKCSFEVVRVAKHLPQEGGSSNDGLESVRQPVIISPDSSTDQKPLINCDLVDDQQRIAGISQAAEASSNNTPERDELIDVKPCVSVIVENKQSTVWNASTAKVDVVVDQNYESGVDLTKSVPGVSLAHMRNPSAVSNGKNQSNEVEKNESVQKPTYGSSRCTTSREKNNSKPDEVEKNEGTQKPRHVSNRSAESTKKSNQKSYEVGKNESVQKPGPMSSRSAESTKKSNSKSDVVDKVRSVVDELPREKTARPERTDESTRSSVKVAKQIKYSSRRKHDHHDERVKVKPSADDSSKNVDPQLENVDVFSEAPAEKPVSPEKHSNKSVYFTEVPGTKQVITQQQPHTLTCIDLVDSDEEEEVDIKPIIYPSDPLAPVGDYSTADEIIILDSDEEDFPCSQFLNTTSVSDFPDLSVPFKSMFENETPSSDEDDLDILQFRQDTWFSTATQPTTVGSSKRIKKLVVDLPIITHRTKSNLRKPTDERNSGESTKHSPKKSKPDTPEPEISDASECKQIESSPEKLELLVEGLKRKYLIRDCVVKITPLRLKRKSTESNEGNGQKKHKEKVHNDDEWHIFKESHKSHEEKKKKKLVLSNKRPEDPISPSQISRLRKEKLKELADRYAEKKQIKLAVNPRQEIVSKPVVKVTNKNRSEYLIDTIIGSSKVSGPKSKDGKKVVAESQITSSLATEIEQTVEKYQGFQNNAPVNPETLKTRGTPTEIYDSYLNDALGVDSPDDQTIPRSETLQCFDFLNTPGGDDSSSEEEFTADKSRTTTTKSKPVSKRVDLLNRSLLTESVKSPPGKENSYQLSPVKRSPAKIASPTKTVGTSLQNNVLNPVPQIADCEISAPKKSNLKPQGCPYVNVNEKIYYPKKTVNFHKTRQQSEFEADPEERRNRGTFAPTYKHNEMLIKEELSEFEAAVSTVCKWNVKWLEEQQKNSKPPPYLYKIPEPAYSEPEPMKLGVYKENLKYEIFLNLWFAIFNSWNKPNQDFLPHTQMMARGDKSSMCVLNIESVDSSRTASLWTIYATREKSDLENSAEVMNGQIVILSLHVLRRGDKMPRKTMVFAYSASVNEVPLSEGLKQQRIIFKTFQKDFEIMLGEAKIKVVTYTKPHLRPFQALAMVRTSPIPKMFVNPNYRHPIPNRSYYGSKEDGLIDLFLDPSQRDAINSCLNVIMSPEPSICLVDGAPGTGKSQVVVSLIHELFSKIRRNQFPDDLKVLVVTSCDHLANDISYRLEKHDRSNLSMKLLRYGNSKGINQKFKYCTLDYQIQELINKDDGLSLVNIEEEKRNLLAKKNSVQLVLESESATEEKLADARIKLEALSKEYDDLQRNDSKIKRHLQITAAKDAAIENAGVVITSVNSCWSSSFELDFVPSQYNKGDVKKFTVVIFDDANYINSTGMLIPIMLMVRTLILVGDSRNEIACSKNLPPFMSLINQFRTKSPSSIVALSTQHRMHPTVAQWFSECYTLNFRCRFSAPRRGPLSPLLIVDVANEQEEALICVQLMLKMSEFSRCSESIMQIIIMTEEQRTNLREWILKFKLEKFSKIRIETLDEISGRENEVVILCLPPSSYSQMDKWLYLSASRARQTGTLIVCGHLSKIQQNSMAIDRLVAYAKHKNMFASTSGKDYFHKLLAA